MVPSRSMLGRQGVMSVSIWWSKNGGFVSGTTFRQCVDLDKRPAPSGGMNNTVELIEGLQNSSCSATVVGQWIEPAPSLGFALSSLKSIVLHVDIQRTADRQKAKNKESFVFLVVEDSNSKIQIPPNVCSPYWEKCYMTSWQYLHGIWSVQDQCYLVFCTNPCPLRSGTIWNILKQQIHLVQALKSWGCHMCKKTSKHGFLCVKKHEAHPSIDICSISVLYLFYTKMFCPHLWHQLCDFPP